MAVPLKKSENEDEVLSQSAATGGSPTIGPDAANNNESSDTNQAFEAAGPTSGSDFQKVIDKNKNVAAGGIFDPLRSTGENARAKISSATDAFNTALGDLNVFDGDEQKAISSYINSGKNYNDAKSWLDYQYTGPSGLDSSIYSNAVEDYRQNAQNINTKDGMSGYLSNYYNQLNPGENRFNTLVYSHNTDARGQARNLLEDAYDLTNEKASAEAAAKDTVASRQAAAQQMQKDAADYVQDLIDAMLESNQKSIKGITDAEAKLYNQYADLKGGKLKSWDGIDKEYLGFDPLNADLTSKVLDYQLGGEKYQKVINPLEYYSFDKGDKATLQNTMSQAEANKYNNALRLLERTDFLTPSERDAANIEFDRAAYMEAIRRAQDAINDELASYAASLNRGGGQSAALFIDGDGTAGNSVGGGGSVGASGTSVTSTGVNSTGVNVGNNSNPEATVGIGAGVGTGAVGGVAGVGANVGNSANPEASVSTAEGGGGGGGGDGGGDGGSVICTELYKQGLMPEFIYRADAEYCEIVKATDMDLLLGYHAWGKPYVRLMKRSKLATWIAYQVATPWSKQMAYEMGALPKPNLVGKYMMAVAYPICRAIGRVLKVARNSQKEVYGRLT